MPPPPQDPALYPNPSHGSVGGVVRRARRLQRGSGNDEFVGLATGTGDIGTVPTTLTLMNQYMSPQGEISANLKYMCTGNTCGGAGDGCYCDAACVAYGDCCTNACSVCGAC